MLKNQYDVKIRNYSVGILTTGRGLGLWENTNKSFDGNSL